MLEFCFVHRKKYFSEVILYEEMVMNRLVLVEKLKRINLFTQRQVDELFAFERPLHEIGKFTTSASKWCKEQRAHSWDMGNFHKETNPHTLLNAVSWVGVCVYVGTNITFSFMCAHATHRITWIGTPPRRTSFGRTATRRL